MTLASHTCQNACCQVLKITFSTSVSIRLEYSSALLGMPASISDVCIQRAEPVPSCPWDSLEQNWPSLLAGLFGRLCARPRTNPAELMGTIRETRHCTEFRQQTRAAVYIPKQMLTRTPQVTTTELNEKVEKTRERRTQVRNATSRNLRSLLSFAISLLSFRTPLFFGFLFFVVELVRSLPFFLTTEWQNRSFSKLQTGEAFQARQRAFDSRV